MSETAVAVDMSNVIPAFFGEQVYSDVYNRIKREGGHVKTEKTLLEMGMHPAFVKAVIRKIMRERGW